MLTFVCIKVGTKYDARFVNALRNMVEEHLTLPHRFVCVTDNPSGIVCEHLPNDTGLEGWWVKLGLFRPNPFGLSGRLIFCDLDNLIVGNIDELVSWPQKLIAVEDFYFPGQFNSAFFSIEAGSSPQVWERFTSSATKKYHGDQDWITPLVDFTRWPQKAIVSYRWQTNGGPPEEAKVICFHGTPKPHEATGWAYQLWQQAVSRKKEFMESENQELETFVGLGNQLRYRCPDCVFDSYAPAEVLKHWKSTHNPAGQPSGVTLFDAEDRPIEKAPSVYLPPALRNIKI